MTRDGKHPAGALICALIVLLCCAAAPTTTAITPATSPASSVKSAIEREPIRRSSDGQKRSTTNETADVQGRANPGATVDLKRVGLSLTLVLGVIFAARFAMKKLFPAVSVGRNSQVISVVSRSVIGPKQQFLLVKLGKRLVLIGDSGVSMNPLAEITDPSEVAELVGQLQSESNHSSVGAFASMFRKAEAQFEPEDDQALATPTASQAARQELLTDDSPDSPEQVPPDRKLVAAASEINGLMDRVRLLSSRLRGS